MFGRMAALPLVSLGLMPGRVLRTLERIEQLFALRSLQLKNQGALETIQVIFTLPELEWVNIQYCKRIADARCGTASGLVGIDAGEDVAI
ncbi:hypothetical protein ACOTCG_26935 [Achromobacter xylosoxidans]